jgi:hypothetical protein
VITKTATHIVATITHSALDVTETIAGAVTNAYGQAGTFSGSVTFPGQGYTLTDNGGRVWTKDAAASTATKTVLTSPV